MGSVTLRGLRKLYGAMEVIKGVDLAVADGEFVVLVGPSGCGKSTLLRMIAGLEDVDYGDVLIDGADVTEAAPARRGVAMVFQNYALYPHMSVYDNMAYGLRRAGMTARAVDERVRRTADMLQIGTLLDRKPRALSGGQRQRVAIGRAIVREPKVFLFDEPLSNLDAALRVETRAQLAALHQNLKATMIFVTHDQVEAMTLADRIVVLNGGRVEQIGTPRELYHRPANLFVAGFIGAPKINLIPARISAGAVVCALAGLRLPAPAGQPDGAQLTIGLRPEAVHVAPEGVPGRVTLAEHLGGETILHLAVEALSVTLRAPGDLAASVGDVVRLAFDPAATILFDADGRAIGSA
jgi:multiple sugar transport system ATP-binding protein